MKMQQTFLALALLVLLASVGSSRASVPALYPDEPPDPSIHASLPAMSPEREPGAENLRTRSPAVSKPTISTAYGKLPLHFEENRGQTDEQVKFLARGRGYTLFLTPTEAVLTLRKGEAKEKGKSKKEKVGEDEGLSSAHGSEDNSLTDSALSPQHSALPSDSALSPESSVLSAPAVMRMKFVGANERPQMSGADKLPGIVNYFIGNDPTEWRTHIPMYKTVEYKEIYPGIDLAYYGDQGKLEYDFVVEPGADPSRIQMVFEGAEGLLVDEAGELLLIVDGGELRLLKPHVYQYVDGNGVEVAANYILKSSSSHASRSAPHEVGIQVATYDQGEPLIIDPVLTYSTYLGDTGSDDGRGIAVDAIGAMYLSGNTSSLNFPGTATSPIQPSNAGSDLFVTKIHPNGSNLIYSTYLGGGETDTTLTDGLALDASGAVYLTGHTASTDFPGTVGSPIQGSHSGVRDAFVTKINPGGTAIVYSTYLGGGQIDEGFAIAVDSAGAAYVTGRTFSTDLTASCTGACTVLDGTLDGPQDAFVTKINAPGNTLVFSTYLGGAGADAGEGIAVDSSGAVYVSGDTASSNFPGTATSTIQNALSGVSDAFVTKIDGAGANIVYSTYLGGSGNEGGTSIAVSRLGEAFVTGTTLLGSGFPTTAGAPQPVPAGSSDVFVTAIHPTGGSLNFSTFLGGADEEQAGDIAIDPFGAVIYVTGEAHDGFPLSNPFQPTFGGPNSDAFITKYDVNNAVAYSSYLGGNNIDFGRSIAVGRSGDVYVSGTTFSTNFPGAATSPIQSAFAGGIGDAFVAKIVDSGTPVSWGLNNQGQLGDGVCIPGSGAPGDCVDRSTPVAVSGLTDIIAVEAGVGHSLALKSDGTLVSWGRNSKGQLGDGCTPGINCLSRSTPGAVINLTDIVTITTDDGTGVLSGFTLALKNDGTVWGWGGSAFGQLGNGCTLGGDCETNTGTPVQAVSLTDVVDLDGGFTHSLALKSDGTVVSAGSNGSGELGDGCTPGVDCSPGRTTFGAVVSLTDVIDIAAGADHNLAVQSPGKVVAWGLNNEGQLGDGCTISVNCAASGTPTDVPGLGSGVVAAETAGNTSYALMDDGTVLTWGRGLEGQLGDGCTIGVNCTARSTPAPVPGLTDVVAIAAGPLAAYARKRDGTVVAWGANTNGQLDGTCTIGVDCVSSSTPVPIASLSGVFAITGGDGHALALRTATVNAAPTATSPTPPNVVTNEGQAVNVLLTGSDVEGDLLTFSVPASSGPSIGTLPPNPLGSCTPAPGSSCNILVTYTPTGDNFGADSFAFLVNDGSVDSVAVTVDLTVNPVNDQPSFTHAGNQAVLEDAGAQSVAGWVTSFDPGPANEPTQAVVAYAVISNDNPGLFAVLPAVAPNGTLTYTPALHANGVATLQVTVQDDGGTANGGIDTSAPQGFTITVTPVNDAPVINTIPNQAVKRVDATAPIATQSIAITGLAPGPAGAADETAQTVSLSVTGNSNPGLLANVVLSGTGATRRLEFQPVGTLTGTATIEVTATDTGAGTAPDVNMAVQSFTITILAPAAGERALSLDLRTAPAGAFAIVQGDTGPVVATGFTGAIVDRALAQGDYTLQLPDTGAPVSVPVTVGANDCDVSLR